MLFAAHTAVQESLGFSPAELLFRHALCSPLGALKEKLLSLEAVPQGVVEYVSQCNALMPFLESHWEGHAQQTMKHRYDRIVVKRDFNLSDHVFVLLSVPGAALSAKFDGPFEVCGKINDVITNKLRH